MTIKKFMNYEVQVREVGVSNELATWSISPKLTDAYGEISQNCAAFNDIEALESDPELLLQLRGQMWDETTYLVRKDGVFGNLYEFTFKSADTEKVSFGWTSDDLKLLQQRPVIMERVIVGLTSIAINYPGVGFAIPDKKLILLERVAAWAFVPDGCLNECQRQTMGRSMYWLGKKSHDSRVHA